MAVQPDLFKKLYENSPDAILIFDGKAVLDCNQAALNFLKYDDKNEILSLGPGDFSPPFQPDSDEKAQEYIAAAFQNGFKRFRRLHCCKDGAPLHVEVTLVVIHVDEEPIIQATWRDIKDEIAKEKASIYRENALVSHVVQQGQSLQQAEKTIQTTQRHLELLNVAIEHSSAEIYIADKKGRITYANPSFYAATGYSQDEVLGQNPNDFLYIQEDLADFRKMTKDLSSGSAWEGTLHITQKDGLKYWATVKIAPVVNEADEIVNFIGVQTDISELIQEKEKAELANRAKSEFLSNMSHELRTPLNAIIGFSQLLRRNIQKIDDESLRAKSLKQIDTMIPSGNHLLSLIEDILNFSQIEIGKLNLSLQPVKLEPVLDEVMELARTLPERYNNQVTIKAVAGNKDQVLRVDATRLRQILINLVTNAVKYNHPDGQVEISVENVQTGMCTIVVRDNGPGISQDQIANIFKPFDRLGAENSGIEGTGIGLSLTHHLVELLNGQLTLNSVVGEGTEFSVSFPLSEVQQGEAAAYSDLPVIQNADGKTILFIEDNPVNIHVLEDFLRQYPQTALVSALDGRSGVAIARCYQPDAILLDLELPDINGFEVVEKIRGYDGCRDIPFAALGTNVSQETIDKSTQLGFRTFIAKPINLNEIAEFLDDCLN